MRNNDTYQNSSWLDVVFDMLVSYSRFAEVEGSKR